MPNATETTIAELTRRSEQRRMAAEATSGAAARRHQHTADAYDTAIATLRQARSEQAPSAAVTVTEEVHGGERRRRTYERAPETVGVEARMLVEHEDGRGEWHGVGVEPLAAFSVETERE